MSLRPDEIARELGLEFTVDQAPKSKMPVMRFTFKFPEVRGITNDKESKAWFSEPERDKKLDGPEGQKFQDVVARVTLWRKKVGPWVFDPPPPGETGVIVAAQLTWGNRWKVGVVNRANRKALKKFWSGESMARRAALMQTTPQQALNALREQLVKYGVKNPDPETLKLKASLEEAVRVIAREETPLRSVQ